MPRLDAVLKELYEQENYENSKHSKRKSWPTEEHEVPPTNMGESAFAVLRLAFLFDGTRFVEKIENFDVSLKFDSIYLKQPTSLKQILIGFNDFAEHRIVQA